MGNNKIKIVYYGGCWPTNIGNAFIYINSIKYSNSFNITIKNIIGPSFLYSKKIKQLVGNYNNIKFVEDYDYWIRVSKYFDMKHLNKYLYFYRVHSNSLSYNILITKILTLYIKFKHNLIDDKILYEDLKTITESENKNIDFKYLFNIIKELNQENITMDYILNNLIDYLNEK